ncbi:BCCT family transporter [Corynebacterium sp. YSMAA1_1_F7]|uniref:BCCT family transporter n=1 Tax=Corynebacterium TaxID=1716 RepID=UPI002351E5F1|nr:BCCT family transporter [Corynebacterium jeikeium]
MCWSPFAGMFVVPISRVRKVHEFIGGVIALPRIVPIIWFSVMDCAGFEFEASQPGFLTGAVVESANPSSALFVSLEQFLVVVAKSVFALCHSGTLS